MAKKDELNFENGNNMAASEKLKALQAAMDKIEKSFGKGSIMKMGDESVEQVEVIPTGSIVIVFNIFKSAKEITFLLSFSFRNWLLNLSADDYVYPNGNSDSSTYKQIGRAHV